LPLETEALANCFRVGYVLPLGLAFIDGTYLLRLGGVMGAALAEKSVQT